MALRDVTLMAVSSSLIERIASAAAKEGVEQPVSWVQQRIYVFVANDVWETAWAQAEDSKTVNVNPDTGARTDVITDQMITEAVRDVQQRDKAK